jgi:hypothetical protein
MTISRKGEWNYTIESGKKYEFTLPQDILDYRNVAEKKRSPGIAIMAPLDLYSNDQHFCVVGNSPCRLTPEDYREIPWLDPSEKSGFRVTGIEGVDNKTLASRLLSADRKKQALLREIGLLNGSGTRPSDCDVKVKVDRLSGAEQNEISRLIKECMESNWSNQRSPSHDVWYSLNSDVMSPIYEMTAAYEMINSCCMDSACKQSLFEATGIDLPPGGGRAVQ